MHSPSIKRIPKRINKTHQRTEIQKCITSIGSWKTERGAQERLAYWKQQFPEEYDSTVHPYRCKVCHHWHLGHNTWWE